VHTKGPVVQSEEYYPFGLTFNGYSRENSVDQNYLYNGKELQDDLLIDLVDYGFRMYNPELGRWHVPDPLQEDEYEREFETAFSEEMGDEYSPESLMEAKEANRYIANLFGPAKLTPENSVVHYNVSPYAYVLNNPMNYQDWMGLDTLKEVVVTATKTSDDDNNHILVLRPRNSLTKSLDFGQY
jgi:RHS repeat-associated protein